MDERLDQIKGIGFTVVGEWQLPNHGELTLHLEEQHRDKTKLPNVLYAFVAGGQLMYIGKTVKSLVRRMAGYKSPHESQRTNQRNHENICRCLSNGQLVEIYMLPDNGLLRYGGFHINLAAGLEDDLINELSPPWNEGLKETENETLVPTKDRVEGNL